MADQPADRRRSEEPCPVCGRHSLALIEFPDVHSTGYLPANEVLGMGEPSELTPPAIGCLSCGTEWASLAAFRAGEPGRRPGATDAADDRSEKTPEASEPSEAPAAGAAPEAAEPSEPIE